MIKKVIGDPDEMLNVTRNFNAHLKELNIPTIYIELADVDHNPLNLFATLGDNNWAFYRKVFSGQEVGESDSTSDKRR